LVIYDDYGLTIIGHVGLLLVTNRSLSIPYINFG